MESDLNVLHASFSLSYKPKKSEVRKEIFDFKNKDAQKRSLHITSLSGKFSSCFDPKKPFEQNVNKFYKTLDDTFHQCFEKYRIRSKNKEFKSKNTEEN